MIGAVNSFRAVAEAVEPSFGGLAWTVPVGVDVGIAVFTALDLLLARVGMRMSWLRIVPWALVATTIYLNVAGEHDPVAAVAHGVLPVLWVIAVEAGSHVVRTHVGLTSSSAVGADGSGAVVPVAAGAGVDAAVVAADGAVGDPQLPGGAAPGAGPAAGPHRAAGPVGAVVWRWRAPRRERALYRLGELAPAGALAPPVRRASPAGAGGDASASGPRRRPARRRGWRTRDAGGGRLVWWRRSWRPGARR